MPLEVGWQAERGRVGEGERASPVSWGGRPRCRSSCSRAGQGVSQCGTWKEGFPIRKPSEPGLTSSIFSASITRELKPAPILALDLPLCINGGFGPTTDPGKFLRGCEIVSYSASSRTATAALRPTRSIRLDSEDCRRSSYDCHHGCNGNQSLGRALTLACLAWNLYRLRYPITPTLRLTPMRICSLHD